MYLRTARTTDGRSRRRPGHDPRRDHRLPRPVGTVVNTVAVGVAGVLFGSAVAMTNVVFISVRQAVVPGDLLGRVGSAQRFVTWGALPIGALLGGWLAEVSTLRVPYLVAAGIVAVTAAFSGADSSTPNPTTIH